MKPFCLRLIILFLVQTPVYAQQANTINPCAEQKQKGFHLSAKTTVASGLEDDYDVKYIKFDLTLSNMSTYINGNVTTTAMVTAQSLSDYVFELSNNFDIDSVIINGAKQLFDTGTNICTVHISDAIQQNSFFTAQVFYRGFPPAISAYSAPGFQNFSFDHLTYSSIEPYYAYVWWPCKQSLTDKIDSVDMWVTVPNTVKVGSNGLLQTITAIDAHSVRYQWQERYPIDYYLISVAVCNYKDTSFYMHFTDNNDSMLIMNYILNSYAPHSVESMLDSVGLMINYFSTLYGRYPFWKEKYGHCYVPSGVSMEHQTMTSTSFPDISVVAHELTHQWFGDHVTCGTWKDIWLNEGFATYGQYLFYNYFHGVSKGISYLKNLDSLVLSNDTGSVYVDDTTSPARIFDTRLTYNKGAAVIHMLRFWFNNDSLFFSFLQTYLQQFAGKTAVTGDIKGVAETVLGQNLDTFYNQWIYGQGYPYFGVTWNQVNNVLFLKINQTASDPASVFTFVTPIEIKLFSQEGDTIIRVYDDQPSQVFQFISNKKIDSIAVDPNNWLLCKTSKKFAKDTTINTLPSNVTVYPNPVTNTLFIAYKNMNDPSLVIYDIAGRKIIGEKLQWQSGIQEIDVQFFIKGIYTFRIADGSKTTAEGKFLKN